MKVSDYVVEFLARAGVEHVFTVSGGGIMHLTDSLGSHPRLRYVCNYHEQASAIAAEGYARIRGSLGACLVTTGPWSTNALSGVAGAWVDSIPMFVISGQVRRDLMADFTKVRQLGPQEINIDAMAPAVTKYFATVMEPTCIRAELEKAASLATSGRPGPAWINIPLDVQGAHVDEAALPPFDGLYDEGPGGDDPCAAGRTVMDLLSRARRPVLVAGNGVRLANAHAAFMRLVDRLKIPVLGTIGGTDAIEESHPCFAGRFGPLGQRRANFVIQNADLILAIGASMSLASVGFNTDSFAPRATKVLVNVDPREIDKARPVPDVAVAADAGDFIDAMLALPAPDLDLDSWIRACQEWSWRYPPVTPDQLADSPYVNSYAFASILSDALDENEAVLTGNSLDWWSVYQSFKVKRGQRVFTNVNFGSMGWDLPAAIGATLARGGQRTILVAGDGTLQFNIQELQTVAHYRLPIKIFVLNNHGYASIRASQQTHFGGRLVGADSVSGVSNPDFRKLAAAYGIRYGRADTTAAADGAIRSALLGGDPVLCEINVDPAQERTPRVMSRRREDGSMESGTLENMYPFLNPDEVSRNMQLSREGAKT
ncbi:MAG: thiamine pyrophosphate-binding protein [Vicinamibacterales bacterium]